MCQDCEDNFMDDDDKEREFMNSMPEHEREEFYTFICEHFKYTINQASERNILYPLITEWSRDRQAAFTMACAMERRAEEFKKDVLGDD